eukprot:6692889-Alexandrium_andersonii.AAC.1
MSFRCCMKAPVDCWVARCWHSKLDLLILLAWPSQISEGRAEAKRTSHNLRFSSLASIMTETDTTLAQEFLTL